MYRCYSILVRLCDIAHQLGCAYSRDMPLVTVTSSANSVVWKIVMYVCRIFFLPT